MYSSLYTGALKGICAYLVVVEVDVNHGLPSLEMVGSLSSEVREARERVKVALKNTGISLPPLRITVNLSPADLHKEGTAFDLPIALGILMAMEVLPENAGENTLFLGELGLAGEIRPVKGVLPMVSAAAKAGMKTCIVPKENAKEGSVVQGVDVLGAENLAQVIAYLKASKVEKEQILPMENIDLQGLLQKTEVGDVPDFSEIQGQELVKRAAQVAAAGFHNLLLIGPPGTGKTMIGRRIPGIIPAMNLEECLEVSNIYSIQGLLDASKTLITQRPFVNPHHTISPQALAGGGRIPKPGAVSLAHRGVLFLDELPEFPRKILDMLRQPLEEKKVVVSRAYGSVQYPADFMLVAAMNPCPCGYYPDFSRCRCSQVQVRNYLNHVSGPLLDRLDICVEAPGLPAGFFRETNENARSLSTKELADGVSLARERQKIRFAGKGYHFNSQIPAKEIKQYCSLGREEEKMLEQFMKQSPGSARSYHRILRLSRTIADLADCETIEKVHLTEAFCYRGGEEKYWRI